MLSILLATVAIGHAGQIITHGAFESSLGDASSEALWHPLRMLHIAGKHRLQMRLGPPPDFNHVGMSIDALIQEPFEFFFLFC